MSVMKHGSYLGIVGVCLVLVGNAVAQVRVTELMASNTRTLADEDGTYADWIELQNQSTTNVNLLNWALSDSLGTPAKWLFPATNMPPGSFLVVFASGKDRRVAGSPLHTNFKLEAAGEYLALRRPDGTVATELTYPAQFPDVAYGVGMKLDRTSLVASNAAVVYRVPANSNDEPGWRLPGFAGPGWRTGTNGLGYETGTVDASEEPFSLKVLQSGPAAYWRLDEAGGPSAANLGSSGVGDEGGYQGNVLFTNAGPRPPQFNIFEPNNYAPWFNGSNAFVNGPADLLGNLPGFTMGGWINPTGAQKNRTGIFGQNDLVEFGYSSRTNMQVWTPYGSVAYAYPYPNDQWHYMTVVGGNGQLLLYVDGNVVGSRAVTTTTFGSTEYDFNIAGGGIFDATGNYFLGRIDEVAVWYRALGTDEIRGLLATNSQQVPYTPYLNTDVQAQMFGSNSTLYIRMPFDLDGGTTFDGLKLRMRYDDGFVAWLNGNKAAEANAPTNTSWNSAATQRHLDGQAVQWAEWDITGARAFLQPGSNVLAVQGLNIDATNTDFLVQAELVGVTISSQETGWRYLTQATPGGPNGVSALDLGPPLSGAGHWPVVPVVGDSLTVTARVQEGFAPLSQVTLSFRSMFGTETSLAMNDSGTDGDAVAGDGVWTGVIPAGTAGPGEMLRYYVTASDQAGNSSRWPIAPDPLLSQQYLGTVVADPSLVTLMPVVHLFVENVAAGDTRNGTQASLFYGGELYDNINISLHGQTSAGWPKKSYNISFPKDHQFLWSASATRQKNLRLLSNYGDKARLTTTLTYRMIAQAGGVGHYSCQVRVQRNAAFFGLEDMVEDGDDLFLERVGRDPDGALYKMYNALTSASGNEKKTRKWEGTDDLTTLITNLNPVLPLDTRALYGWDNLDLPQATSYFATMALASSQDHGHKNYYMYHDNDGNGEWAIFPWDVDLTWGRNWTGSLGYFSDILYNTNVLNFYDPVQQTKTANRLYDLFFGYPEFRQMYLRRLRTLMDTILKPASTAPDDLVIEPVIRQYEALLAPTNSSPSDAELDFIKWGPIWGNTNWSDMRASAEREISYHLAGRRDFLFASPYATLNGEGIPASQPPDAALTFGTWDCSPVSGNPREQYVELQNLNDYALDASGWLLSGAVSFRFRPGTVVPAGRSLYVPADVNAFRARSSGPSGGQNLYVQGPFAGYLSTLGNSRLFLRNATGALVASNFVSNVPQFLPGNVAVLRVGDGVEALSSRGNSLFVDQFTPAGDFISSSAVPNSGANALLASGSASSEGALTRSADNRLLMLAGYHIGVGASTSSLPSSASSVVPRAAGVMDTAGAFALTTLTSEQYSRNNIRSATSDGMGDYWAAGANSGTWYLGDGVAANVQNALANTRVIWAAGDALYFSTGSGMPGIWKINGLPKTPGAPVTQLLSSGATGSPYGFAFNRSFSTAYVADDTLAGSGGVQRWDNQAGLWTLTYSFAGLTNSGARGLACDFSGPSPVIFATTAEPAANRLVSITDTGALSVVSTLAASGANQLFRGVALAPEGGLAPRLLSAARSTNGLVLAWSTLVDRAYELQCNDNLATTNWVALTNLVSAGPVLKVEDIAAPMNTNRFYRVVLKP